MSAILGLISRTRHTRGLTGNIPSLCYNSERCGVKLLHRPTSVRGDPFLYHSIIPPVEHLTLPSHYPCCHDLDKVTFSLPDLCVLIHNIIYCVIPPSAIKCRMPLFPFWVSGFFFIPQLRRRAHLLLLCGSAAREVVNAAIPNQDEGHGDGS